MSHIPGQLILQLILILLNAFFAATEIAVISLNEKKLKARAADGDKKAGKMLHMIEDPTQFLSTIQIGITLAGFLGSAFAADNFAEGLSSFLIVIFHVPAAQEGIINTASVVVITLILSFFTLVLGELVPKRVAMKHKEKLAEAVCGMISLLAVVLKPIIWLLTASTNLVLRTLGIDPTETEEPVSQEDIVLMLDAGADEGSLNEDDIAYIKNVFKLDTMTAEDVMTPRKAMVLIPQDASPEQVLSVIRNQGYSRIPVYAQDTDHIIGILHARDYLLYHQQADFQLGQALLPPTFVPETIPLDTLFQNMQQGHNHMVIVINEYGETAGIVTMEDILEELVGEIWDEQDEAVEDFLRLEDGSCRVLGTANLEDFFEFFHLSPDDTSEATTVNGWVMAQLGALPRTNDTFQYGPLSITVLKADQLMAQELLVKSE